MYWHKLCIDVSIELNEVEIQLEFEELTEQYMFLSVGASKVENKLGKNNRLLYQLTINTYIPSWSG